MSIDLRATLLTQRGAIKSALVIAIIVNLALVMGGVVFAGLGESGQQASDSRSVATLQARLDALQARADELQQISAQEAESRALNIFTLAEVDHNVQVWNLSNENRRETIARRDVQVFATSLELRGSRAGILGLLRDMPAAFEFNLLIDQVTAIGTEEEWNVRLSLRQIIQG